MPEDHPRLKRHFSVVAHSADVVELRHGAWNPISYTVSDDAASGTLLRVINHLDGRSPVGTIARDTGVPKDEVEALLDHLEGLGVLEHAAMNALDHYIDQVVPNLLPYARPPGSVAGAAVVIGDDAIAGEIVDTLTSAEATIAAEVGDPRLQALLRQGGSDWLLDSLAFEQRASAFASWGEHLVVHVARSVHPTTLQVLNRLSLHHGFPWLHATIDGPFLLVGPTFAPFRSACFECLEARVLMNLRESASYQRYKHALADGRVSGATDRLDPVLAKMLASHTAFEALNFLVTGASFTAGKMLAIYLPTFEFTFNEVLRLPGCAACSPAPERDDRELYFELRTILNEHP
jgi:bacteriocin biosynthesis cyclodehydratase domain-containing protein